MLDSIYVGMSGLISFSKGLNNISNNVANMNTPGFKGTQLEFLDLCNRYANTGGGDGNSSPYSQGSGVKTGATTTRFADGIFSETGNDLDLAVEGNGFFVVRKDGKTFYTRNGQFVIDDAGYLVTKDDGSRVAGMKGGGLSDISVSGLRSNPPKPTSSITFTNSLDINDTQDPTVTAIPVYDSLGVKHEMTLVFKKDTTSGLVWNFTLSEGTTEIKTGVLNNLNGEWVTKTFSFGYTPTNGAPSSNVTLDFSDTNQFSSSGTSSIKMSTQDGYAAGYITQTTFDGDGYLVLTYSNSQTVKKQRIALAWFDNLTALESQGQNRFAQIGTAHRILGAPGESTMGELQLKSIERSNVELSKEFSELIIIQRGYQASSQIISAANEMIQQLGELQGKR